ncbi:Alanine--tRNA ligase, partial [Kickxella alabastrina]
LKVFAIVEETSIAKGIRRITAVTGDEAFDAQKLHKSLETEVKRLHTLTDAELDAEIKRLAKELDTAAIGVYEKHVLLNEFNDIRKKFAEADKAAKALAGKQATELVQQAVEQNPDQDVFVLRLPIAGKVMAQVATYAKSLQNKAVYFIAADGPRVAHQCVVGKPLIARGLKAHEWAECVSQIVGGKKGGKDESAQGSGTEVQRIDEAIKAAEQYAKANLK